MNFFFGLNNDYLKSKLTIPRFQNRYNPKKDYNIFEAEIVNNKWIINKISCNNNESFFFLDCNIINNSKIFFLAKEQEVNKIKKNNFLELINFNTFTDTAPAFRANLQISNENGGFSSYQSEYPYSMIIKKGNILSPISSLADKMADKNIVFLRNIYHQPIQKEFDIYFLNIKSKKILFQKKILTNFTNEIIINKEFIHPEIFLFTNNYLGIPVYVSMNKYHISCEHTHPPHEYILSKDKYTRVSELKNKCNEIINK
jgi:hypothetical protein